MHGNRKPEKGESLLDRNPELCKEWDYSKNYPDTPEKYRPYSNELVWWKCGKCNNSWLATITNRSNGMACPKCWGRVEYVFRMI